MMGALRVYSEQDVVVIVVDIILIRMQRIVCIEKEVSPIPTVLHRFPGCVVDDPLNPPDPSRRCRGTAVMLPAKVRLY